MIGKQGRGLRIRLILGVVTLVLPLIGVAAPVVTEGTGADPASLQGIVDAFRGILGDPLNGNAPGPLLTGRREINWDGGGATTASPAPNPFAGFQNSRGALFTTDGTGFLQTPLDAPEFLSINPTYGTTFQFFSPVRIFTAVGSNTTDATFTLPGNTSIPAWVTGFGVVFSDVDMMDSATLEFFNLSGNSLGTFSAPALDDGLSFVGVTFDAGERVGRVRITSGNVAPGPDDGPETDVVMMDDFLYSEPQPVPEPATMLLLATGLAGMRVAANRRRKKVSE
jgi:hypothetical protein